MPRRFHPITLLPPLLLVLGCSVVFSNDTSEADDVESDGAVEFDAAGALTLPTVEDCDAFLDSDGVVVHDSTDVANGSLYAEPSVRSYVNGKCGTALSLEDGYIGISDHLPFSDALSIDFWLLLEQSELFDSDGVSIFSFDSRGVNAGDLVIMLEERNNGGDTPRVVVRVQDGRELGVPGDGYYVCGEGLVVGGWNRITLQVGANAPLQLWVNGQPAQGEGPIDIFALPDLECGADNGHSPTALFAANDADFVIGSYLATTSGNPDFSLRQGAIDEIYVWPQLIVE